MQRHPTILPKKLHESRLVSAQTLIQNLWSRRSEPERNHIRQDDLSRMTGSTEEYGSLNFEPWAFEVVGAHDKGDLSTASNEEFLHEPWGAQYLPQELRSDFASLSHESAISSSPANQGCSLLPCIPSCFDAFRLSKPILSHLACVTPRFTQGFDDRMTCRNGPLSHTASNDFWSGCFWMTSRGRTRDDPRTNVSQGTTFIQDQNIRSQPWKPGSSSPCLLFTCQPTPDLVPLQSLRADSSAAGLQEPTVPILFAAPVEPSAVGFPTGTRGNKN